MKATQTGPIIGKALENYSGSGVGKILVFVSATYADPVKSLAAQPIASNSLDLTVLGKLTASGALVVGGPAEFKANVLFDAIADFVANVIFRGDVTFSGRAIFNRDTAGSAIVKKGTDAVNVSFQRAYDQTPFVNISISLAKGSNQSVQTALEQSILSGDIKYIVTNMTTSGFTIKLNKAAPNDLAFSWTALAVKDATVSSSSSSSSTPSPSASPILPPSQSASPSANPLAVTSPSPSPSPSPNPAATPSSTNP